MRLKDSEIINRSHWHAIVTDVMQAKKASQAALCLKRDCALREIPLAERRQASRVLTLDSKFGGRAHTPNDVAIRRVVQKYEGLLARVARSRSPVMPESTQKPDDG